VKRIIAIFFALVFCFSPLSLTKVKAQEIKIVLDSEEIVLKVKESKKINATILEEGLKGLRWVSENPNIAVVDDEGNVTGVSKGETFITVYLEEDESVYAKCKVKVEPYFVNRVILSQKQKVLKVGDTFELFFKVEPEDAEYKDVKWLSTNQKVAEVENGKVIAKAQGEALIKVVVDGIEDYCKVKVEAKELTLEEIEKKIIKSQNEGILKYNTYLYNKVKGKATKALKKSTKVLILDEFNEWYFVKVLNMSGWIPLKDVQVIKTNVLSDRLSKEELEFYVNKKGFKSKTAYFIWVDTSRQRTYVFKKDNSRKFVLVKDIQVATGKDETPTKKGLFELDGQRGEWMYFPDTKIGVKNWVRIVGRYLFHSVLFARDKKTIVAPTLGKKASHGCIRLSVEDSLWFYKNIPSKTTVWIN